MKGSLNILGHNLSITPTETAPKGPVEVDRVRTGIDLLKKYKAGKEQLEARIIENEKWYKLRHWEVIRKKEKNEDPEPVSAWLFNSLANKHADAMDNYPDPNILPRKKDDEKEAQTLTTVIPLVLEKNEYEETYSDGWWYKLKNGTAAYGCFWDPELEDGLGDISIRNLDLLNLFWEPGKKDLQKSRGIFIVDLMCDDLIEESWPWTKGKLKSQCIDVKQYVYDDAVDTSDKSVVVDWYYRKKQGGKWRLHLCKFVGETLLWASENDEIYAETGIYDHGNYPVHFDVLFPEEGTPTGFGYIDVMRSPQMYIDKLNQIVMKNALLSGKKRYMIKEGGGVNEQEFLDWSKDLIHVNGSLDEDHIRELSVSPLNKFIVDHLQMKIDELKETSGNRDFGQGSTAGGVTAASAIAALQEAGNKLSRDMIKGSYRVHAKLVFMCIELARQFYDEARTYRIEGVDGQYSYVDYNNAGLSLQQLPPAYPGEGFISDPMSGQLVPDPNYEPSFRKPVFDIKVRPQKSNPFSRMAQNENAKELYARGFFDPARADQSLIALDLMDFEGKETVIQKISHNKKLMDFMLEMRGQMDKMAMIIQQLTGQDMFNAESSQKPRGGSKPLNPPTNQNSNNTPQNNSVQAGEAMPGYAQRMAAAAPANINSTGRVMR